MQLNILVNRYIINVKRQFSLLSDSQIPIIINSTRSNYHLIDIVDFSKALILHKMMDYFRIDYHLLIFDKQFKLDMAICIMPYSTNHIDACAAWYLSIQLQHNIIMHFS